MLWAAWPLNGALVAAKSMCYSTVPASRVTACSYLSWSLCRGQPVALITGCQNPSTPRRVAARAVERESVLFGNCSSISVENDRSAAMQGVWIKLYPSKQSCSRKSNPLNPYFHSLALQPFVSKAAFAGNGLSVTSRAIFPQHQHQRWTIPKLPPESIHKLELSAGKFKDTQDQYRSDQVPGGGVDGGVACSSVVKKRKQKMNRHKYKKRRKKMRFLRRRLGK